MTAVTHLAESILTNEAAKLTLDKIIGEPETLTDSVSVWTFPSCPSLPVYRLVAISMYLTFPPSVSKKNFSSIQFCRWSSERRHHIGG